jgi:hypothetical protein
MAIQFKSIKSSKLGLTDKITFGKFANCRVCDLIEDQHEYLIWAEKSGFVKFEQTVVDKLLKVAGFSEQQRYYNEEVRPWEKQDYDESDYEIGNSDLPDVPF